MKTTDPELAQKWVDVMRAPGTRQTFRWLRRYDGSVCALGALCEAAVQLGRGTWVEAHGTWYYRSNEGDRSHANYPTPSLTDVFSPNGQINVTLHGVVEPVFKLNDTRRMSLPQIADLVEKEYL